MKKSKGPVRVEAETRRETMDSRTDEELVTTGRVVREWGLRGELLVEPMTFDPARFDVLEEIAVQKKTAGGDTVIWRRLLSSRPHGKLLLMSLEGCRTPEEARLLRGALLRIRKTDSPAQPEGVYYHYEIIGLTVVTGKGERLGRITAILETGSNDVYVVRGETGETLVPAIKQVVKSIDTATGSMVVDMPGSIEE